MTKYPYKTREGGATVTIFVPYDCGNNCPFCINKQEYANPVGFSLEKICESIRTMDSITPKCDFVFTGGEPFADLDALQTMLDQIPPTHNIFINTTLPTLNGVTEDDLVAFTEKNKDKITCINCSRHVVKYVAECSDEIFGGYPWFHRPDMLAADTFPWSMDMTARTDVLRPELVNRLELEDYVRNRYRESVAETPRLDGESLEEACMVHGIDVDKLLALVNEEANKAQ